MTTHVTKHPLYSIYKGMKERCNSPTCKDYHRYGERGITVCDRWLASIEDFGNDMGPRPSPLHQIERKDNNGPYSPENCRWATAKEQGRNRRDNVVIEYGGESKTVAGWGEHLGMQTSTLWRRLFVYGWSMDKVVQINPRHPNGKRYSKQTLTEESVLAIRRLFSEGRSKRSLSREFSVSPPTILAVVRRDTWTHLP